MNEFQKQQHKEYLQQKEEHEYHQFVQGLLDSVKEKPITREEEIQKYGLDVVENIEKITAQQQQHRRDEEYKKKIDDNEIEVYKEFMMYNSLYSKVSDTLNELKVEIAKAMNKHKKPVRNNLMLAEKMINDCVTQYLIPIDIEKSNSDDDVKDILRKRRAEYEALEHRIDQAKKNKYGNYFN